MFSSLSTAEVNKRVYKSCIGNGQFGSKIATGE